MQNESNKSWEKEDLEACGIFDLRHIARELGHTKATTLKKAELIEYILSVDGKVAQAIAPSKKRGRPPKKTLASQPNILIEQEKTSTAPTEDVEEEKTDAANQVTDTADDKEESNDEKEKAEATAPPKSLVIEEKQYPQYHGRSFNSNERGGYDRNKRGNKQQNGGNLAYGGMYSKKDEDFPIEECVIREGILEVLPDGYGFIRANNFRNSPRDTYLSLQKIRKYSLRTGDLIQGYARPQQDNRPMAMVSVTTVNGFPAEKNEARPNFDALTPIYPDHRFRLEIPNARNELAVRAIDLLSPIGKGQRAMIVSPPKAGKTTLLKMIANSIAINYPDSVLMVLLIDERPEEVTDMQRNIRGEVIYSTFDEESENHIKVAELVLARAKRIVEQKKDVVILLDSLTRLARANNVLVPSSGRTLSGGVDPVSLYFPKRFFGAARNIENGGSLTIIATALIDTGSRMDDVVYEEFKGTGNMEIHLDRRLSERRIFPAIDLYRSGTRKEELLLSPKELEGSYAIRRLLSSGDSQEASESVISLMSKTKTNDETIRLAISQLSSIRKDGFRI